MIRCMQAQAKIRMESNQGEARTGVLQVISSIWEESGLSGFWAGLLPALVLVVNPAMQYMLYEQLLHLMRRKKQERILARQAQEVLKMSADPDGEREAVSQSPQCLSLPPQQQPEPCQSKLSAGEIFIASALAKIGATGELTQWLLCPLMNLLCASHACMAMRKLQCR